MIKILGKILALALVFFLNQKVLAQTFTAKGGLVEDATVERFSRSLFSVEVVGLPERIICDGFGISEVCINVEHERLSDLKVTILSPDGTEVWLSNRHGHNSRVYNNTCFSMDAPDGFIYNGKSNFYGDFIPDANLNNLNNGQNPNGTWFLVVEDLQEDYFGFLSSFQLTFDLNVVCDPSVCELDQISDCECPDPEVEECELLPDLIVLEKNTRDHIQYFPSSDEQYPRQIRFSASMANIGVGPLEVYPIEEYFCEDISISDPGECDKGSLYQTINQNIYKKLGDRFEITSQRANRWYFDNKRGHNHYHVDGWTDFKLLKKKWWTSNPLKWKVISESSKVSYCLMDSNICLEKEGNCEHDGELFHKGNLANFGLGNYFQCDQHLQGISVGAVDNYGMFYEGQFVDVPEALQEGTYYLYLDVDPDNFYTESNEKNNSILLKLFFERKPDGTMSMMVL